MVSVLRKVVLGLCVLWGATGAAWGQQNVPATVLPGRPANDDVGALLGDTFESKAAGISFRAPAKSSEVRKPGVPDLIVEYVNEANQAVLKVATLQLREPRKLAEAKDERGQRRTGLLEETVLAFMQQNPTAEVLRKEISEANGLPVGLVAYRYNQQTRKLFRQDAVIPLTDTYYYSFSMISPGAKDASTGVDEQEKLAADIFREVLDTVKLYDRTSIAKDQDARIARSSALLSKLKSGGKIVKQLQGQQWYRLMQDGKDIGYTFVVEELAKEYSRQGTLISIRSRTMPSPQQQVDVTSRMFISDDWNYEGWSHTADVRMDKNTEQTAELGLGEYGMHYRVEQPKSLLETSVNDKDKQPKIEEFGRWKVEVRNKYGDRVAQPLEKKLPEYYLPQAIQHLLPRLLPLDKPDGYMFLSFVSENHQFMARYADVGEVQDVELGGQKYRAVPVTVRVGLDGAPTKYYVSPEGKYIGSESSFDVQGHKSVISVVPTDEGTLQKLWKNAKLSKPEQRDVPEIGNPTGGTRKRDVPEAGNSAGGSRNRQ